MVRNYIRKTERHAIPEQAIRDAVNDVVNNKTPIRVAAARFGIRKSTLFDRLKKQKPVSVSDSGNDTSDQYEDGATYERQNKYACRQVFSIDEERQLETYLLKSSEIQYGLTYAHTKTLAYEYAVHLNKKYPKTWDEAKAAGRDWMTSFMKRHPQLTYQKPENTSFARSSAFNKNNVDLFFENYTNVMTKFHFTPEKILNIDETGITTVLQAPKVIAQTGKKQVGQCVSAERGQLVTFCGIISATGVAIPPFYIFPRIRMKDHFLNGSPPGAVGYANKSGWMTAEIFIKLLEYIKNHTRCSPDNKILLILDNHETHVSLATITFCRNNGTELLSFPPHCTHRMQPLDIGVFGPFKSRCKKSFNDFILAHPGRPISIYDVAMLTAEPYLLSFSPLNITKAFQKSGIWPINRLAYDEKDFAAAYATDRTLPSTSGIQDTSSTQCSSPMLSNTIIMPDKDLMCSNLQDNIIIKKDHSFITEILMEIINKAMSCKTKIRKSVSIFDIKALPKAAPRKNNNRSRCGKSRILTSTPEKDRIQEIEKEKAKKCKKDCVKRIIDVEEKAVKVMKKRKKQVGTPNPESEILKEQIGGEKSILDCEKKKMDFEGRAMKSIKKSRMMVETDSSSESDILDDDHDDSSESGLNYDDPCDDINKLVDDDSIENGDYLLVKFATKKKILCYIGVVTEVGEYEGEYMVKFLRKGRLGFHFPQIDDISLISRSDVIAKLPHPDCTTRLSSYLNFGISFSGYNIQ